MHRQRLSHRRPAVAALSARGVVAVTALALVLTGCASPHYKFVTSKDRDVVLRIPRTWNSVAASAVQKAAGETSDASSDSSSDDWVVYFDASTKPSAQHVRATKVTAPVLIAQSSPLPESAAASVTNDQLRDVVLPVSADGRAQLELSFTATGRAKPKFRLIRDEEIRTKTETGVHVVFGYDLGEGEEIFDQVAVTDPKRTRVHVLLIHCATACFTARQTEIYSITDTFTVKKAT